MFSYKVKIPWEELIDLTHKHLGGKKLSLLLFAIFISTSLVITGGCSSANNQKSSAQEGTRSTADWDKTAGASRSDHEPLLVVTSNNLLGDFVRQISGERVSVQSLLRPGMDPHTYQALPSDMAVLSKADLIVVHGAGLDVWVIKLIKESGSKAKVYEAAAGLQPRQLGENGALLHLEDQYVDTAHEEDEVAEHEESDHIDADHDHDADNHDSGDPHFWFDPNLVQTYVENIKEALIAVDPEGAQNYEEHAARYVQKLSELDRWIQDQVDDIPEERRKLVTNHDTFGYFAARYGFAVIGTVIPSFSTDAQPSAMQIAKLSQTLRDAGVTVVFSETTINAKVALAVAREVGALEVIPLYTGSLSDVNGPADTYLKMMRYNVKTIAESLGEE